jgi:fatty-acyl-CoA synthase
MEMMTQTEIELDWLKRWNLYTPNKVALQDGDTGQKFTYHQFYQAAVNGAQILKNQFQINHGDRVAVLAANEIEYVILFFALQRLGAILVPVNFRLTQREVEHIVEDCRPKLIFYQEAHEELVENIVKTNQFVKAYPLTGSNSFATLLKDFNCHSDQSDEFLGSARDGVMILYTSGTTGAPKGALLNHEMLFWNSINTTLRLNISQADCTVCFLPFFHTGGWNILTNPFIHRGAKTIFLKKFVADQILALTESEKATLLFGVPTTMDMLSRSPSFSKTDLSSLRYAIVGGEPMPLPLIETWHHKGIPIRQGYGLTEFGPNVFSLNEEDALRKIGSIGFPNFYTEAKIINEQGQSLGANEVGELILKGPMAMVGYWNNEKATKETLKDGWLYTGDLVRRDAEGYFYVVGRKKDMYKSGGENVYPTEIEQVLRRLDGVREVAVIGVIDEKWGEVGKAFIVKDDPNLTEQEIGKYCLQNLAKFKIPRYFSFLPSLPKGDSGKVLKRNLVHL